MKRFAGFIIFFFLIASANAQVYLRGIVTDNTDKPLSGVSLYVSSSKLHFTSGVGGNFGILVAKGTDTILATLKGYDSIKVLVVNESYKKIVLSRILEIKQETRPKRNSVTKNDLAHTAINFLADGETYFQLVENDFVSTASFPKTNFALNVNKASYSNLRRFLTNGQKVPPDAVRIEEMLNYFNLNYTAPLKNEIFDIHSQVTTCPWNPSDRLLFITTSAKKLNLDTLSAANFVFLIDVSGSMDLPNRLPLLKAAFKTFVNNLRAEDKVSIVIYGGTVALYLDATPGDQKDIINQSIEVLTAAGDTPGERALELAYKTAIRNFIPGGNNRIILATDGDFNIGIKSESGLDELVSKYKNTGIHLSCLGVGMGNFKDSRLHILAEKGNGSYAYIDDAMEAEKVLVKELTRNLYAVASNVNMEVDFNSEAVETYRLIGFDNRKDAVMANSIELEGGEIGSGSSSLAVFQFTPVMNNSTSPDSGIARVNLSYQIPGDSSICNYFLNVSNMNTPFLELPTDLKFATSLAMFGMKLKLSPFAQNIQWEDINRIAIPLVSDDDYLTTQFLQLVNKAGEIYSEKKRKKRR